MKCTLCSYDFDEDAAQKGCENCLMMKGCKLIKCPNCGFETPPEPGWIKYFMSRVKSRDKKKGSAQ